MTWVGGNLRSTAQIESRAPHPALQHASVHVLFLRSAAETVSSSGKMAHWPPASPGLGQLVI